MIIQILPKIGEQPIQLDAAQFIVLNDAGTPIIVAAEYGPQGAIRVCHAGEGADKFNAAMRAMGYGQHKIIVDELSQPPAPRGARLIGGPGV
jgi:hypothetical protein